MCLFFFSPRAAGAPSAKPFGAPVYNPSTIFHSKNLASFSSAANESRALFPNWSFAICKMTVDTPFLCSQLRKQRRICFSSSQFSFRFPTRFFSPLTARSSDEQFGRAKSKWKFQTTVIPNRKRIPSYGSSSGCTGASYRITTIDRRARLCGSGQPFWMPGRR